jgi:hypothetical protein
VLLSSKAPKEPPSFPLNATTTVRFEERSTLYAGNVMSYRERYGSKKADYKNAQRVGVGVVGHSILHHHEENLGGTRPNQP